MTNYVIETYDYVMNELGDPRVKDWFGFSSLILPLSVVATYLLSVYVILPAYMKNREPYSLKTFLYFYNIFQVVYNLLAIRGVLTSDFTLYCQPVDYSFNRNAVSVLHYIYYVYILKIIELVETMVFVLRKKDNQVSKLHVYHHASTYLLAWIGVKFVGGGMVTFPVAINCSIHVMMYTYYFLTSLGEEWQNKISQWKPWLTMFQMIQFCILIIHALQTLHPECKVQKQLLLIYLPDVFVVFYMFWEFYQANYIKKKED